MKRQQTLRIALFICTVVSSISVAVVTMDGQAQPDTSVAPSPIRLEGVVLAVRGDLVEISLGSDDGVRVGQEMEVFRKSTYLGRIIIRRTASDRAVGEIIRRTDRGPIRRGDRVAASVRRHRHNQVVAVEAGEAIEYLQQAVRSPLEADLDMTEPKDGTSAGAAALKWLAEHQSADGGWSFDHRGPPCNGRCGNPGTLAKVRNLATAMALLPILQARQTHKEGEYKKSVERGLAFLLERMKKDGSLEEPGGGLYSHALATLALCEAYGMTQDKQLMQPAQAAVDHIGKTQDAKSGGWPMAPDKPCSTPLLGWQLMALKSGHMAYLHIDQRNVSLAGEFLNTVQSDGGAAYGTYKRGRDWRSTAAGLLSRLYLGWKHKNPALRRGVDSLSRHGPSEGDMSYNLFATLLMKEYGGSSWTKWRCSLHNYLVKTQEKSGLLAGSWFFHDGESAARWGGRLYCTAMASYMLMPGIRYRQVSW